MDGIYTAERQIPAIQAQNLRFLSSFTTVSIKTANPISRDAVQNPPNVILEAALARTKSGAGLLVGIRILIFHKLQLEAMLEEGL